MRSLIFLPGGIIEESHCRLPRSRRWNGSGGGCSRRPFCRKSLSGLTVHGIFGSQEFEVAMAMPVFARTFYPNFRD